MRRVMSLLAILLVALSAVAILAQDSDSDDEEMMDMDYGLVSVPSEQSVDDTVASLQQILEEAGFIVPLVINHSANAANVDLELLPTQLVIFGNPNAGTPLMQNQRSIAIDLPQKYLVWEDEDGQVFITYNDPFYLGRRHGLEDMDERLTNVSNALANFAEQASVASDE